MISTSSLVEISNVVVSEPQVLGYLDPKMLFWIVALVADAASVNPNGTYTLLACGVNTFFMNGRQTFISRPRIDSGFLIILH